MFTSRTIGILAAGSIALSAACSSAEEGVPRRPATESSGTTRTDRADAGQGAATATDTSSTEPVDCVPAGTKGNAKGVGAFCQSSSECKQGTFCTAGPAPKGAEFCTAFCSTDADCGEGASCFKEARGTACVPAACLALLEE